MSPMQRFLLTLLIVLLSTAVFAAEDNTQSQWVDESRDTLKSVATKVSDFERGRSTLSDLVSELDELNDIRVQATNCIEKRTDPLKELDTKLESLGEKKKGEDAEVSKTRNTLQQEKEQLEKESSDCKQLELESDQLITDIKTIEAKALAAKLFAKKDNVYEYVKRLPEHNLQTIMTSPVWDNAYALVDTLTGEHLYLFLFLTVVAYLLGALIGKVITYTNKSAAVDELHAFLTAIFISFGGHLKYMMLFGSITLYFYLQNVHADYPLVFELSLILLFASIASFIVRSLLDPPAPAKRFLSIEYNLSRKLSNNLRVLSYLGLLAFPLFDPRFIAVIGEQHSRVVMNVYLFLVVVNLVRINWLLGGFTGMAGSRGIRFIIALSLVAIYVSNFIGYTNFSFYLLLGLLGTGFGLTLAWLLTYLVGVFLDGLDEGHYEWQKRLRRQLGINDDQEVPGLAWIRFGVFLTIWIITGLWLLWAWGVSRQGIELMVGVIFSGFTVGGLHIVPLQLVWALIAFIAVMLVTNLFKHKLIPNTLRRARLDRGAKDAMVTMTGYIGVLIGALIALSVGGFDLTNLAIIAGALSVGIGFGLQNIVNNFISGIILLVERPIRAGDWVVVGTTEGYVKKISIRSTIIQTFDRSDVIVPNSELISTQVTNWMFKDTVGRITVPVGVAYGSDVRKVEEILIKVAKEHEMVITSDPDELPIRALFRGFGDSSLNFELRCFIREVDYKLKTISDLNFAIDAAFREAGVEIPFPQRDLHIRSGLPGGQLGGPKGGADADD